MDKDLLIYVEMFKHLRTSHSKGFKAPHKAILLISIIQLVREKIIVDNEIYLTKILEDKFKANWHRFIQIRTSFICNVNTPFEHIENEKFCDSISTDCIKFDDELYALMSDPDASEFLIATLIATYLSPFANKFKIDFTQIDAYADMSLRPYQSIAKDKIYKMWTQMRSIMFQMPTGTGKTRLFVSIVRDLCDWGAKHRTSVKVLILAHRKELIAQIDHNVGLTYKLAHGLIMANNMEQKIYPVQIGSVPTLVRRLDRWTDKEFDIIIIDEAHHVKAESYKRILDAFPKAKVLGVTATPYRMNGAGFRPEFDELIVSPPVSQFIQKGYLCDYDYYSIRPSSQIQESINRIRQFAFDGDYLEEAISGIMDRDEIRAGIVSTYEKFARGKKGIVYTINKAHNCHVCSKFVEKGYRAEAIDSDTPADLRERIIKEFKSGLINIICNVNIFSEGFDCPDLEFIQLARPTKSLSMFLQQVGRGLRPSRNKKKLIILDNVGLYNRFGFPSSRRHWRYHFEGHYYLQDDMDSGDRDGRDVLFFDDYVEGDDEVEMIHSSQEEETQIQTEYEFEDEFSEYLKQCVFSPDKIQSIISSIKDYVDTIISDKFDSRHTSILNIDDVDIVSMYFNNFKSDQVMSNLDFSRQHLMTNSLEWYIRFLNWRQDPEAYPIIPEQEIIPVPELRRSLSEVIKEMEIFRKYDSDIPAKLQQEYDDLTRMS